MTTRVQVYAARGGVWSRRQNTTSNNMWVGATTTDASGSSAYSTFTAANAIIGPLRLRRTFIPPTAASSFPSTISATPASADVTGGSHVFLSMKPSPISDVVAGAYDAKLTSLAQSVTGNYPCWMTMFHEPEGNQTVGGVTSPYFSNPADFVAMFQHFYTVIKAANSSIQVGTVHLIYQWGTQSGARVTSGTEDQWWVGSGFTDFLGADTYWNDWQGAPTALQNDPSHMHWHNWAAAKGKPLYLVERGVRPVGSAAAAVLLNDETWLKAQGYGMFCFWDAMGTGSVDWRIDSDQYMAPTFQGIAQRGRSS